MLDSRSDRAVRSIVIHVASFAYAMGFFISTKKFLDFPATDPIAVGRVTVEAASKLQDYVRFGYFILIVPLLTLLLIHWLPRIGRRVVRSIPRQTPLSIVAFASLPLAISPFLYLTTYKEVWSVLLPPLLAWLVLAGWIAFARFEWLRSILSAGDRETHALVVTEGLALILFRYIATGSRIAHIPSLLLETIFLLFFLALWWVTVLALALLIARTPDELEPAWRRVAAGCFPLMLLPVASILPVQPLAAFAAALLVTVLGIALFLLAKISLTRATIAAMTAWIAAPLVIFVLSYASSAHTTGWVDLFHQGETLGPASDYLQGKVPYEGVFPLHGLLQDGLLDAWLMEFLGRSADVAIQRSTVLEALMLPAIWILSWVAFRSWSASAASVLAAIVLAADNQRAVLLIVVATLFLAAIRSGRNWILFAAGILSAATLFFSLEIGIYCFVGGIALLLALPALEPSARALKGSVKSAGYFSAGMAAGAAPFLLYLSASGVTHE
ncbi:MAG: hypothetical protein R3338_11300, partial [Thermoanaerobaculia bacterium]|nr:hypothetical protein [Thermoanaerobaculia bacterium]